jgi:hypothetical protein
MCKAAGVDPDGLFGGADPNWTRFEATALLAITRLRDLGYINDIGLRAIKAEERK